MAPNFFIVGAPKCGTTALYHCLRKHPEIYMPFSQDPALYWIWKEPNHFCGDLGIADWLRVEREEDYLRLFEGVGPERLVGSASALKLMSQEAPGRIAEFSRGEAKVVIMLRPPVEWMKSWHHDLLRHGYEDEADFAKALELGEARDAGNRLPRRPAFRGCMNYKRRARFTEQVRRYYECFGKENVFVGLLEDLNKDGEGFVVELLKFLNADSSTRLELTRENDSGTLRRTHLLDLQVSRVVDRLPAGEKMKAYWKRGPEKIYDRVVNAMAPPLSDKSLDAGLERELREEFRDEVADLGELIGRDLSHW